ncbi:hypothetical protein ACJMK2_040258 [Sinanodonta woodiana]|uniref:Uncharacterized protein n=1 Tax=Sinanodonta woodiana TaxID=1069815 RepID=A0ABD3WEH6_SINWO
MIIDLKIHWLPLYIHDDIIREVLGPFGKVFGITRDFTIVDKDNVTPNGTRLVKLQTTEFDSKNIPPHCATWTVLDINHYEGPAAYMFKVSPVWTPAKRLPG